MTKNLTCWVVTEGLKGTENQCLGVAEALGVTPVVKQINLRQPWTLLSPCLGFEQSRTFIPPLKPPWPDLLLAGGRKAIAAARYIKKQSAGKTFTVFLQDPRISPRHFDLVAAPMHDSVTGPNVIKTLAAPNRITPEQLKRAKRAFPGFETIKQPRIAVLIGGRSKAYKLNPETMRKIAESLKKLEGGIMITTSRRTGAENETILKDALLPPSSLRAKRSTPDTAMDCFVADASRNDVYLWDGEGENPYMALLAWADYILVTADSASMLSEAATTGKPVYMIPLPGGGRRIEALHQNLIEHGALRIFEGSLEPWDYTPLGDAQTVAKEIEKRLKRPAQPIN